MNTSDLAPSLPANEALLSAWLRLSTSVINSRLVSEMSYNESLICGILYKYSKLGETITATELCQTTRILKSQMNRTLTQLEEKGLIRRERSASDKRRIEISLNLEQAQQYEKQHKEILEIIDHIITELGAEETKQAIALFHRIADIANKFLI